MDVYTGVCKIIGTHEGQKKASDSMRMELKVVMSHLIWVLGTELGFTIVTVHTLNF